MAIFYILFGCVAILALNWGVLRQTVSLICHSAFSAKAGIGGLAGNNCNDGLQIRNSKRSVF